MTRALPMVAWSVAAGVARGVSTAGAGAAGRIGSAVGVVGPAPGVLVAFHIMIFGPLSEYDLGFCRDAACYVSRRENKFPGAWHSLSQVAGQTRVPPRATQMRQLSVLAALSLSAHQTGGAAASVNNSAAPAFLISGEGLTRA